MSSKVFWILSCVLVLSSLVLPSPIETNEERSQAIAQMASEQDGFRQRWPWQAIVISMRAGHKGFMLCGGTLVHPEWVLTTAYCIRGRIRVDILTGVWNISNIHEEGRTFYRGRRREIHPCYEDDRLTGVNIGLVQLDGRAPARDVVCLPNNFYGDWEALIRGNSLHGCVATGFGRIDASRPPSSLKEVTFTNVSKRKCETSYGSRISNDKICAYGNRREEICDGDIGGPLVCRSSIRQRRCNGKYLAAVTLAGSSSCGDDNRPGVYTAVFPHIYWIENILNVTKANERRRAGTTARTTVAFSCNDLVVVKLPPNSADPSLVDNLDNLTVFPSLPNYTTLPSSIN